jgi:hypothetical protein
MLARASALSICLPAAPCVRGAALELTRWLRPPRRRLPRPHADERGARGWSKRCRPELTDVLRAAAAGRFGGWLQVCARFRRSRLVIGSGRGGGGGAAAGAERLPARSLRPARPPRPLARARARIAAPPLPGGGRAGQGSAPALRGQRLPASAHEAGRLRLPGVDRRTRGEADDAHARLLPGA